MDALASSGGGRLAVLVRRASTLGGFACAIALLYLATAGAVLLSGLTPAVPLGLPLLIAVVGLPFALCLTRLLQYERARGPTFRIGWPWCLAMASAILLGWHQLLIWPVLAAVLWVLPATRYRVVNRRVMLLAALVLIGGYGAVWNLNYLLERYMSSVRWDPQMRALDLVVYRWWFGADVNLTRMFPLAGSAIMLRALDNAYAILLSEVMLVAFLFSQMRNQAATTDFLRRLLGLYLLGIVIFMIFPVNGQHLYYPEQQDLSRSLPSTVAFASGMMHDFMAVKTGGQLLGFGYFIAVPSLHVLVAVFLQHCLRPYPVLFRMFLPINAAICASTVLLGYHYIFDVVAAVVLYGLLAAAAGYPGRTDDRPLAADCPN